jgi:hypothetical protein
VSAVLALRAAQAAGAHVSVRDGKLIVLSNGALPAEVIADLRQHRDQLVGMLLEPSAAVASEYKPWLTPNVHRVWYPGYCRLCGRRMHDGDYVCPVPEPRDNDQVVAA